jgi:hypothetical protein
VVKILKNLVCGQRKKGFWKNGNLAIKVPMQRVKSGITVQLNDSPQRAQRLAQRNTKDLKVFEVFFTVHLASW